VIPSLGDIIWRPVAVCPGALTESSALPSPGPRMAHGALRQASLPSRAGIPARATFPEPGGTDPSRVRQAARKMSSARPPRGGEDPAEDAGDVVGDHVRVGAGSIAVQHLQARRRAAGFPGRTARPCSRRPRAGGDDAGDHVTLGSMNTTPRPASASARICAVAAEVSTAAVTVQSNKHWISQLTGSVIRDGWKPSADRRT
jgi:hypothetical protein